jgi:hypothetical protein
MQCAGSVDLTIAEAAEWLDPPIGRLALAAIVAALGLVPVATRQAPVGRPARTYDAAELMRLHTALAPWLATAT